MDDNYFDKKLKNLLQSPPDFEPDATAIDDMKARLHSLPRKKNFPWIATLLSLLFLLFLSSSIFFYQKYNHLQEKLTTQFQLQNHTDTIIKTQIIYQIDTVYNTIYHTEYITSNTSTLVYNNSSLNQNRFGAYTNTSLLNSSRDNYRWSLRNHNFPLFATHSDSSFSTLKANSIVEGLQKEQLAEELKNGLSPIAKADWMELQSLFPSIYTIPIDYEAIPNHYKKSKVPPIAYFRPQSFSVEAQASPIIIPSHGYDGNTFAFGIYGNISFPQRRSMRIGAEYLQTNFELKDQDSYDPFPLVDPTDPTDNLHELKANLSYLQIPISFQQTFLQKEKWSSDFSLGLVAYKPLRQQFIYEYLNNTEEYKLPLDLQQGSFSVDNIRIGLHNTYNLSDKLTLNAAIQYQHGFSLNPSEYFRLRYWGIDMGFRYRLFE